jgi:hypothetical protein
MLPASSVPGELQILYIVMDRKLVEVKGWGTSPLT